MKLLKLTIVSIFLLWGSFSLLTPEPEAVYAQANPDGDQVTEIDPSILEGITVRATLRSKVTVDRFRIRIPLIGVDKRIIPNVNPVDHYEYLAVIDKYVAHGMYTRLPFEAVNDGNVYLFAHREGSSGFFNRLDELREGSRIEIDFNQKTYVYSVNNAFVVDPEEVSVYTGEAVSPTLTLQTCTNGNKQRLIVKASLQKVSNR